MSSPLKLLPVLPRARRWVRELLEDHHDTAQPVSSFGLRVLEDYFPTKFLHSTKVVVVDETPNVPLAEWGLDQVGDLAPERTRGITFEDTFFVVRDSASDPSLFLHEMIHVVQWQLLGISRFLVVYGFGLMEHGYLASPLERMAYGSQARFDAGERFDAHAAATAETADMLKKFRSRFDHRLGLWLSYLL